MSSNVELKWWQREVVYQVYPRSFQDSDGDGVGDLTGITRRLDYLAWLGVGAVWLSPIYRSPMRDFGYDVTDYTSVDPLFGDLTAFDALVAEAHALGLRVILDVIPSHSSAEHPWFGKSRASRASPKRDWYIWRDPAPDGGPPNNWRSVTGGSAWSFDEATGQYFLHSFLPFQPDLNWRDPEVRAAMLEAMRFWLERGVDGLRVDMVDFLIKDAQFRDEPDPDYSFATAQHHLNQPEIDDALRDIRNLADAFPERVTIGEINPELSVRRIADYYGDGDLLQQPFNFGLLSLPFDAASLKKYIATYTDALPSHAWPNYTLGNHDTKRLATRIGQEKARLAALLLMTLRGTPYIYYGDELGMENVEVPAAKVQDPWETREPGKGRDPNRTPMQWDATPHVGFTTGTPWLPVGSHVRERNVEAQMQDSHSLLRLYKRLLELRKSQPALTAGEQRLPDGPKDVLMLERFTNEQKLLVILNIGAAATKVSLPTGKQAWQTLFSTVDAPERLRDNLTLCAFEGLILGTAE